MSGNRTTAGFAAMPLVLSSSALHYRHERFLWVNVKKIWGVSTSSYKTSEKLLAITLVRLRES